MATGKKYYWIKLREPFMKDDEVDYLMGQENGANYVVLYMMLCLMTKNTEGRFVNQVGDILVPYDINKIKRECRWFSFDTIRVGLQLFKALKLIYEDKDGIFVIANHHDIVGSETDYAKQKREQRLGLRNTPRLPAGEGKSGNLLVENSDFVEKVDSGVDIVHTDNRDKSIELRDKNNNINFDSPRACEDGKNDGFSVENSSGGENFSQGEQSSFFAFADKADISSLSNASRTLKIAQHLQSLFPDNLMSENMKIAKDFVRHQVEHGWNFIKVWQEAVEIFAREGLSTDGFDLL